MKVWHGTSFGALALSALVLLGSCGWAVAETNGKRPRLYAREHILRTIDGASCLLGIDLSASAYGSAAGRKTARFKVEVYRKNSLIPRRARKAIWSRNRNGGFAAIDSSVKPGKRYRYTLITDDRNGAVISRMKIVKVPKVVRCDTLGIGANDNGEAGIDATPTPRPTKSPNPTATPTPHPTPIPTEEPTATPTPTPSPTPTEVPADSCDSLSKLLNDWGLGGVCDFDGSGAVDAGDLSIMLGVQPKMATCTSTVKFKAQYGSAGICDLNHDGTVNAPDARLFVQAQTAGALECLSLNEVLASWGHGGPCDLSLDGVVDATDLPIWLSIHSDDDPACKYTQTLLAFWGKRPGACDKDEDGDVDGSDLAILIEQYPANSAVCGSIDELLKTFGTDGPCDLNGDRTIDQADLAKYLGM